MEKRNTIQKQLVLDAVSELANHPTADAVYDMIAKTHPTVSRATVYRNLGSLSEDGRLRHIRMPGGADRFDHCLTDHCHIECNRCGALADAPIVHETTLDAMVATQTGFTSVSHDTVYHGICPICSKKLA